jgi:hypothetical protein
VRPLRFFKYASRHMSLPRRLQIAASGAFEIMMANKLKFVVAAGLGFCVNTLAYTSIKLASSLTLKVKQQPCVLGALHTLQGRAGQGGTEHWQSVRWRPYRWTRCMLAVKLVAGSSR